MSNTAILAPFLANISRLNLTSGDVTYGEDVVDGHAAFAATWSGVSYFAWDQHVDLTNTFQVVMIDRSDRANGDFDVEFNYGHLTWDSDDYTGGTNGLGGWDPARAAFSNGTGAPGSSVELPGSAVSGGLLDGNAVTGLVHGSHGSTVAGRYLYEIRNAVSLKFGSQHEPTSGDVFIPLDDNYDLGNHDDAGNPVPDDQPDATAGIRPTQRRSQR